MQDDKLGLIGKTIGEVAGVLDAMDYTYRVVERDGVKYMVTADFVPTRANLTMVERKVVKYTLG